MPRLPYREIIEMRSVGLSERKVASLCGCGVKKVGEVIGSARRLGIGWPVPAELSDDELEQLVDPLNPWRRHQPDFPAIREILGGCLKKKDLDAAYDAYVAEAQLASTKPYVKATFKRALLNWLGSSGEGVSMRINWAAGEEVQVDWAGRTLGIVGADGRTAPAFLFVATMPYSGYTFIRASLDMGMQTWLEHHCSMFEFFGGVPIWLAPDNLAQAVYFKKGGGKVVNRKYQDLADHYGIMVEPTRVATPTDKGAVEGHVRIMANRAMKTLEGLSFSSINQLNRAVSELLALYNSKPSPALGGMSRHELFVVDELPCLQRLPEEPYSPCSWRSCRVAKDDVVAVRGNHYGVPEGHAGSKARVRIGVNDISIFTGDGRQLLAEYPRREDGSETFDGLSGVCPDRFRPLSDWCAGNAGPCCLTSGISRRTAILLLGTSFAGRIRRSGGNVPTAVSNGRRPWRDEPSAVSTIASPAAGSSSLRARTTWRRCSPRSRRSGIRTRTRCRLPRSSPTIGSASGGWANADTSGTPRSQSAWEARWGGCAHIARAGRH